MSKTVFKLNYDDNKKITNAIKSFKGDAEKTINDYLRNEGKDILINEITQKIPISQKGKKHAKTHKWYKTEFYNLAIVVSTSTNYYYLKFVNDGTGTSRKGDHAGFVEESGKKASEKITIGLIKKLEENLKLER